MDQNRNLFVAVGLSALFMLGWWTFAAKPQQDKLEAQHKTQIAAQQKAKPAEAQLAVPTPGAGQATGGSSPAVLNLPRGEALARGGERIAIKTPLIEGSLRLAGARFDDIRLKNYHVSVDPKSPEIELLSPYGSAYPYFVQFDWRSSDTTLALPNHQTPWKLAKGDVLAPGKPVVLTWTNPQGLTFTRTVTIDDKYMFTVKDHVTSAAKKPVSLMPYARVQRIGVPHAKTDFTTYLLHEGFVGVAEAKLQEAKYSYFDEKDAADKTFTSKGGWLAITDKYWMAAIVPPQGEDFAGRYHMAWYGSVRSFLTDYNLAPRTLAPGASLEVTQQMFGGAKVVSILRQYEKSHNVEMFDYATDWGWFWMFTRPLFWVLDNIFKLVGNFGLAIILATIVLRLLLYPMANHQFKSMGKMKKLQPQMEAIKKKFADDQQRQQQEIMELFKREKANPVAGCLPMLIQFPILFAFYKVQVVTIEMFHAPFFGWIKDLSAPDPTSYINLFGLLPWGVPTSLPLGLGFLLHVGLWPILMGITQWVQMKMNPSATDPVQQKMFALMPLIFTFMFAAFPAGLVIYYTWNNLLSMAQQAYMMKKEGVEIHLFNNLPWLKKLAGQKADA
jgi:YidC/Oxa1 family membrane protein insertase